MKQHPDYPTINEVDSFLISNKQPNKLLSQSKNLVESKHTNDTAASQYSSPSKQCLEKISKVFPQNLKSTGTDSNANLKAFVSVMLQIIFDTSNKKISQEFIQKMDETEINSDAVQGYKHANISPESFSKIIVGFLKTLSHKRLKSQRDFSLYTQIQSLPIILDYFAILCRSILMSFGMECAGNYSQRVETSDSFEILGEFFQLSFIQRDNYYFFEEPHSFIYDYEGEVVYGNYGLPAEGTPKSLQEQNQSTQQLSDEVKHIQDMVSKKYEKQYNLKIMECSMESGSHLFSSRQKNENATPCFTNNLEDGLKFNVNKNDRVLSEKDQLLKAAKMSQEISVNHSLPAESYEVNVYTENNKKTTENYELNKFKPRLSKELKSISNQSGAPNTNLQPNLHSNDPPIRNTSPDSLFGLKPKSANENNGSAKELPFKKKKLKETKELKQKTGSYQNIFRAKSDNCAEEVLKFRNKIKKQQVSPCHHEEKEVEAKWDKIFEWENDERRLRRVETICYKTCTTCHRRFYKNQIKSKIFEVQILPATAVKAQETFLQKKFHKNSADTVIVSDKKKKDSKEILIVPEGSRDKNAKSLTWLKKGSKPKIDNCQKIPFSPVSHKVDSPSDKSRKERCEANRSFKDFKTNSKHMKGSFPAPMMKKKVESKSQNSLKNMVNSEKNRQEKPIEIPKPKYFLPFKSSKDFQKSYPIVISSNTQPNIEVESNFKGDIISTQLQEHRKTHKIHSLVGSGSQQKRIKPPSGDRVSSIQRKKAMGSSKERKNLPHSKTPGFLKDSLALKKQDSR